MNKTAHWFPCFSFDDNGDCLDPKMMEELTVAVGKVNIETPKSNYKAYLANVDLLSLEEFPHVLECSNFPAEFRTQDLMLLFTQYKESGFDIKWVDDTHCLVIFSSAKVGELVERFECFDNFNDFPCHFQLLRCWQLVIRLFD